ncbi:hypothetical protein TNCV_841321 [Trichonephila clavipes]|nr:hypothetical protein TNCV_841321 [Trichonephila clavipes]
MGKIASDEKSRKKLAAGGISSWSGCVSRTHFVGRTIASVNNLELAGSSEEIGEEKEKDENSHRKGMR